MEQQPLRKAGISSIAPIILVPTEEAERRLQSRALESANVPHFPLGGLGNQPRVAGAILELLVQNAEVYEIIRQFSAIPLREDGDCFIIPDYRTI